MRNVGVPFRKQPAEAVSARPEVLSGWKEIASYLGKAIRTVQRYERGQALPIHRPAGKSRGAVFATKPELDTWVTASSLRAYPISKSWPASRANQVGAKFLQVDSEIALTFCSLALEARDEGKRRRTGQTARRAYDTIMSLREGIELTDAEQSKLNANLDRLRSELQSLGQTF
jgi:hypothetical protein